MFSKFDKCSKNSSLLGNFSMIMYDYEPGRVFTNVIHCNTHVEGHNSTQQPFKWSEKVGTNLHKNDHFGPKIDNFVMQNAS